MKPQENANATEMSSSGRVSYVKFNKEGTTVVRLVGIPYRRFVHYVDVEKADGDKQRKMVICSNYDYESSTDLVPNTTANCILDEVYDGQMAEKIHPDLPWVSFPKAPEKYRLDSRGNEKPPQRAVFQANFLSIDRTVQKENPAECVRMSSFKKLAWNRILTIATGASEGGEPNPAFAKGDPANSVTGYDIAVTFNPTASPSEMYTVTPANEPSPLTEEEQAILSNFEGEFNIAEYFRVRTREEVCEYLDKARDTETSFNYGAPFSRNQTSSADVIEAELKNASLEVEAKETEVSAPPF